MQLIELMGWFGFTLYLIAYFLLAVNRITAGMLYFSLNIAAAFCIIVVSLYKGTYQAVIVNFLWGLISYIGIVRYKIRNFAEITFPFRISIFCLIVVSITFFLFDQLQWTIAILAWIYVLAFIISYLLFVAHRISIFEFHIWNIVAALSILPKLIVDNNWPVFALEIFWISSALFGIAKKFNLLQENPPGKH